MHHSYRENGARKSVIQAGGCCHSDLNGLLGFTKASAKWYMGCGRFLEEKTCKDCSQPVWEMLARQSSDMMVFYCDQGIKGYDALDDDPMKEALTCDLVLCVDCEGVRRVTFEKETTGCSGRRLRQRNV